MNDIGYEMTEDDSGGFTARLVGGVAIAGHGYCPEEATQNLVRYLCEIVNQRNDQLEKIRAALDLRIPPVSEDVYEPPPLRSEIPMRVYEYPKGT